MWRTVGLFVLCATSCGGAAERPQAADPLHVGDEVRTFQREQRSTGAVPGTVGRLGIRLGDIEHKGMGTVIEELVLIDHLDEHEALSLRDAEVGQTSTFNIEGTSYRLTVLDADSSHILHDVASFELSRAD